ncbi:MULTISPECIES: hypothetical protein [Caballeronia]|uniref:Lipoprotein n=1 Tax=Caballeronia cordobensis TaxID=1353886 RepID=A0A158JB05_CABCO|nr:MULTISPECIES: hypothetical protein [Caballeronia]MCE4541041.1 hypothetical protein [Caballeronia sp. PC1]MCE4569915.1 hypothetical protein [Caballeronia sp. CLC5]BAO87066.1 uncharacterized protein precursor [Burkholderia sp. RPE67]SAL65551.1 hypothetical protein AWB70_06147 [Caballeronia cordobensis]
MSRFLLASVLGALMLCAGCAGAPSSSAGGGGSITMYGTIDQGITVHD